MKGEQKYDHFSHCKTSIRYHIIFSTKYRRDCLQGIRKEVLGAFRRVEGVSDFKILKMELDRDHIHLLMTWKPNLSISQVVRRLKQMTARILWEDHKSYLKGYYWRKRQLWTGGYFCSTIGEVSEERIRDYIENQGK